MALTVVDGGLLSSTNAQYTGFKNRIINGAMVIAQYGTSAVSATTTNARTYVACDRWAYQTTVASKFTVASSTTAPAGFINSLLITSSTAYTPVTGDAIHITQPIEGLNITDLGWGAVGASSITISFWVRSSLTGTFGGALQNSASSYSYPFTYTINSANTFEQKTITITGPTSGTWLTTNGVGIFVIFSLGVGTTYAGTAGSWSANNYQAATGQTNLVATSSATLYITGVQLEKGSTATSFDYRPYGQELLLCQRYCEAIIAGGSNAGLWPIQAGSTTNSRGVYSFKVQKRASASFTNLVSNSYICQYGSGNFNPTAVNLAASNASGAFIDSTCSGLTLGQAGFQLEGTISNGATICLFTAEL
jgi:hypothetical protein